MLSWRTASLFWHLAVVRRVGCRLQRQAGCRVSSNRTRAGSSCLWGGYAARARLAALVAVCIGAMKERCTGGRRLSFDTRPWCDVSGAASNAKPAAACAASAQAPALAISREEAQHSSLLRARASLRWLWSAGALQKSAAPARGFLAWCAAVVRRLNCRLQRQAGCRVCSKRPGAGARYL